MIIITEIIIVPPKFIPVVPSAKEIARTCLKTCLPLKGWPTVESKLDT